MVPRVLLPALAATLTTATPARSAEEVTATAGVLPATVAAAGSITVPPKVYDPKRWAVLIGVSRYAAPGLSSLNGPSNDARNLTETLIDKGRFDPNHVIALADDAAAGPPTNDNIIAAFSRVVRELEEDSLLFIFFAGHGIAPRDEAFLLPSNVVDVQDTDSFTFQRSALPVAELRKFVEKSRAKQVVLFIDACRDDPRARSSNAVDLRHSEAMQRAFRWEPSSAGPNAKVREIVTFFSAHPGQKSYETGGQNSVGYFSDAVVRALRGDVPMALRQPDGVVTVSSLIGFVTAEVSRNVRRDVKDADQNPYFFHDGGDDVVLTFPGIGGVPPPPRDPTLRLRLPTRAVNRGAVVTRNHFNLGSIDPTVAFPVRPGTQFLEVKVPGYRSWSHTIDLREGDETVDVSLQPDRRRLWLALGGAAVGAGLLGTGIYYNARAHTLASQVTHSCQAGCFWRTEQARDQEGQRAETKSLWFISTGAIGAIAGLGLAAYFYWAFPPLEAGDRRVAIRPTAGGAQADLRW
jgi:hypothetical protein